MRRLFATFWIPALAVVGLLTAWILLAPCARPRETFRRVTEGMTEEQVREQMGAPFKVRQDAPAKRAYFYGGLLNGRWCTMEVYFDASGRVTGKFHDH